MDYQLLETFIVVSEVKNLTKAAHLLYKTQPTISSRIQQLENFVGYSLIVRKKGKQEVVLTQRGKLFLEKARKLYNVYNELIESSSEVANSLILSSIASYQIPIICNTCERFLKNRTVNISINTYQTEDVDKLIAEKKLDFALVSASTKMQGIKVELLFHQNYYLVLPRKKNKNYHYLDTFSVKELSPEYEIYQPWDEDFFYWHNHMFQGRQPRIYADSYAALKEFFVTGKYWTILQESNVCALKKDMPIEIYRIDNPPPTRSAYMLTNMFVDKKIRPLLNEFKEQLLKTVEEYRVRM